MEFIRNWFDQLDDYIKTNLSDFSCNDYSMLYQSFLKTHKERSGTSENLTGFSEYLANRLFLYLIQDKVELSLRTFERIEGISGYNVPDMLIYKDNRVFCLISVKAFGNISNKVIFQDLKRIDNIRKSHKSITLNFLNHVSMKEETIYKYQRNDHKLLFLKDNHKNLIKEISDFLFE